ncbi:MAG: M48 family metallopeptidase [Burkholderiaceae bacterium]|nr:M48 family metallopeptidase [Burkholderiaceae bacterium]
MSTSPSEPAVAGLYFDGRSARPHPVVLSLHGGELSMSGADLWRIETLDSLRLSEPMGEAPRLITFSDGSHVEVRDHARLAHLLAASGQRDSAAVRWAFEPRAVLVALALLVLIAWFGWRDGLPWAARHVAASIPAATVRALSGQTLQLLETRALAPSELDASRQRKLDDALRGLARFEGSPIPHRLLFRTAPRIGANAFALPDGTLVVTDELVALAGDDDEVLAVLAHELGHVHERHGLRLLLQGSVLALFMTWYLGDAGSWLAAAPAALVQATYSREMEYEADDFALRLLRAQGLSSEPLAVMLEKLQAARAGAGKADAAGTWLDSHPRTAERIARLRGQGGR